MGPDRVESLVVIASPLRRAWRGLPRVGRVLGWICTSLSTALILCWSIALVWCYKATSPAQTESVGITYWLYPRTDGKGYLAITWGDFREKGNDADALEEATRLSGIEAKRPQAASITVRESIRETRIGGRLMDELNPNAIALWRTSIYSNPTTQQQKWLRIVHIGASDGYDTSIALWTDHILHFTVSEREGWIYHDVEKLDPLHWEAIRDATLRHANNVNVADLGEGRYRAWRRIEWPSIRYLFWLTRMYLAALAVIPALLWALMWFLPFSRAYHRLLRGLCPHCTYPLTAPDGRAMCTECGWNHAGMKTK